MSRRYFSILTVLTALTATTALPLASQTPERVQLTGDRVGIWNIAGKVSLTAGTGRGVQVTITRHGSDASQLNVAHGPISGMETLRVIYPDGDVVYSDRRMGEGRWRTELDIRDDGTFGDDDWRHHGGDGHRIRVSSTGSGTDASADLDIQVPAGQEVTVHLVVGTISARNVDGKITLDTHAADVTTAGMKGDLRIDTGSGDVNVDGMEGPLSIDVGSGDVTLANVKGAELDIDTGSGDVRGTGIAADVLKVDTGSGGAELDGLTAQQASIDVGSGDVELTWTVDPGDVDIDTGSGDVRLTLPATSGGRVDFESSSGDIESDFEISTNRIERDELHGTFGDGRGRIQVETGSGDVNLVKR